MFQNGDKWSLLPDIGKEVRPSIYSIYNHKESSFQRTDTTNGLAGRRTRKEWTSGHFLFRMACQITLENLFRKRTVNASTVVRSLMRMAVVKHTYRWSAMRDGKLWQDNGCDLRATPLFDCVELNGAPGIFLNVDSKNDTLMPLKFQWPRNHVCRHLVSKSGSGWGRYL